MFGRSTLFAVFFISALAYSCSKEDNPDPVPGDRDLEEIKYNPTRLELILPDHFPSMPEPEDNLLTVEGVELGRQLFYDPILSRDSSMSCSTCHLPNGNFTDNLPVSTGITGAIGRRSAMNLLNVGFNTSGFFWDGRSQSLEELALLPVEDETEMDENWDRVETKLRRHLDYPILFRKAFGINSRDNLTRLLAAKAMAQFMRTLVSTGQAKYDRVISGETVFTDLELDGHDIFFDIQPDRSRHAECGHCHNAPLFTTNEFFNNGIDQVNGLLEFADLGRGEITGHTFDNGTFKVPTLRNIEFSAPFMHDGRFKNLDDVIDHYETGGHVIENLGAVLRPLSLSNYDRMALKAFIHTLHDPGFIENPDIQNPFK